MTKTEQLNRLFAEWEQKGFGGKNFDVFCKDGIVDEKEYKKILFVLKDVNNAKPDEDVDLRKSLTTLEDEGRTWFNIARWTATLLSGELIEDMTAEKQHELIRNIAVVNLKKEAGGASVSDNRIRKYASKHDNELRREIAICDPDVVIACGNIVYDCLKEIVFEEENYKTSCKFVFNEKMKNYGEGFDIKTFLNKDKPVYVIHYRHPNKATLQGTLEEHHENFMRIKDLLENS